MGFGDADMLFALAFSGNKRDRVETLTQCAEWSKFTVDYFLAIWFKVWNCSPSKRNWAKNAIRRRTALIVIGVSNTDRVFFYRNCRIELLMLEASTRRMTACQRGGAVWWEHIHAHSTTLTHSVNDGLRNAMVAVLCILLLTTYAGKSVV